jgi:hypothetical protein
VGREERRMGGKGKREGQKTKAKFKIIKGRCGKRGQKRTESEGVGLMLWDEVAKVAQEMDGRKGLLSGRKG